MDFGEILYTIGKVFGIIAFWPQAIKIFVTNSHEDMSKSYAAMMFWGEISIIIGAFLWKSPAMIISNIVTTIPIAYVYWCKIRGK